MQRRGDEHGGDAEGSQPIEVVAATHTAAGRQLQTREVMLEVREKFVGAGPAIDADACEIEDEDARDAGSDGAAGDRERKRAAGLVPAELRHAIRLDPPGRDKPRSPTIADDRFAALQVEREHDIIGRDRPENIGPQKRLQPRDDPRDAGSPQRFDIAGGADTRVDPELEAVVVQRSKESEIRPGGTAMASRSAT